MKLFQCAILLRLYLMLSAALYGYTAVTHPETLVYRVANHDTFGLMAMWAMLALALLGLFDMLVNDLMPARFVIRRALHDRHLVNMGLSICFAVQMFIAVRYHYPLALLPYYGLNAVFIPLSALADIQKRYKKGCA